MEKSVKPSLATLVAQSLWHLHNETIFNLDMTLFLVLLGYIGLNNNSSSKS